MSKKRRRTSKTKVYTHSEREAIVAEIQRRRRVDGLGIRALASQLGITEQTYYNWLRRDARPEAPRPAAPAAAQTLDGTVRAKAARRYSEHQRRELLEEIARRVANGLTTAEALAAVDLGRTTYRRWLDQGIGAPPFRMVAVGPEPAPATALALVPVAAVPEPAPSAPVSALTLVAPGGYRIEGLAVESAAALLRALS